MKKRKACQRYVLFKYLNKVLVTLRYLIQICIETLESDYNYAISQVLLILEYCSGGELRSYLIKHQSEFKQSLNDFHDSGKLDHNLILPQDMHPNDIILLYRWTYQVW